MNQHTTIHAGDHAVIHTGNYSHTTGNYYLQQEEVVKLQHALNQLEIATEDINEILETLKEKHKKDCAITEYRKNAWLAKMKKKAEDGLWKVSIATATQSIHAIHAHYSPQVVSSSFGCHN